MWNNTYNMIPLTLFKRESNPQTSCFLRHVSLNANAQKNNNERKATQHNNGGDLQEEGRVKRRDLTLFDMFVFITSKLY